MSEVQTLKQKKGKEKKKKRKKENQDTLYGPAQTQGANTLHISWQSGSGEGWETMKQS